MVKVSGHSDDLIELDGDISEEFTYHGEDDGSGVAGDLLAFSNGVVLKIWFLDRWRIEAVAWTHTSSFDIHWGNPNSEEDDTAEIYEAIWCVRGDSLVKR